MNLLSRLRIRWDFEETKRRARKLDAVADRISTLSASECEYLFSDISSHWQGENATQFLNKGIKVEEDLNKLATNLHTTADTIRQMAQNTYDAEMKALEIARTRSFNR